MIASYFSLFFSYHKKFLLYWRKFHLGTMITGWDIDFQRWKKKLPGWDIDFQRRREKNYTRKRATKKNQLNQNGWRQRSLLKLNQARYKCPITDHSSHYHQCFADSSKWSKLWCDLFRALVLYVDLQTLRCCTKALHYKIKYLHRRPKILVPSVTIPYSIWEKYAKAATYKFIKLPRLWRIAACDFGPFTEHAEATNGTSDPDVCKDPNWFLWFFRVQNWVRRSSGSIN